MRICILTRERGTIKVTLTRCRTYTTERKEGKFIESYIRYSYNERPRRRLWLSFHERSIQMSSTSEASYWRIRMERIAQKEKAGTKNRSFRDEQRFFYLFSCSSPHHKVSLRQGFLTFLRPTASREDL